MCTLQTSYNGTGVDKKRSGSYFSKKQIVRYLYLNRTYALPPKKSTESFVSEGVFSEATTQAGIYSTELYRDVVYRAS